MANIQYSGTAGGTASWPIFRASVLRMYQSDRDTTKTPEIVLPSLPPNRKERRRQKAIERNLKRKPDGPARIRRLMERIRYEL